jgi:hypothetical protein
VATAATEPTELHDLGPSLDHLRLRLADVLGSLRPASGSELDERLRSATEELSAINGELEVLLHQHRAEQIGLSSKLDEVDRRLAEGWEPEAAPVEEVVERLRHLAER